MAERGVNLTKDGLLPGVLSAIVLLWAFAHLLRRWYVAHVQATWNNRCHASHFAPVEATRFFVVTDKGHTPCPTYDKGTTGALGLADGHLVFLHLWGDQNVRIPLDAVRWANTREIEFASRDMELISILFGGGSSTRCARVLIVYCEFSEAHHLDRRMTYAWTSPELDAFGDALAKACKLRRCERNFW
jgi:hypothetical protein